jgi:hypothetical protein
MRRLAFSATLCVAAVLGAAAASADDQIYKCIDPNGVTVLSDKPCEALTAPGDSATLQELPTVEAAAPVQRVVVKEHYMLPSAEYSRSKWASKPLVTTPPKVDVATLKAARLNLELGEKTASLR